MWRKKKVASTNTKQNLVWRRNNQKKAAKADAKKYDVKEKKIKEGCED
jgi:hypothetical protein